MSHNCADTHRRDILRGLTAIAGAGAVAGASGSVMTASATEPNPRPSSKARRANAFPAAIDTHAHLWPAEYLDELDRLPGASTGVARNLRATDSDADMAQRLQMMDRAGVKMQVLSATPQVPQAGSAGDGARLARMINDVYAGVIRKYPGRFAAYGCVPLPHIDESIKEARRAIQELGFKGVALNTLTACSLTLADESLLPLFAELDRLKAIVYVHPTGCAAGSKVMTDYRLEWVVGAPIEDTVAALHLLKADIPHKFPNIRFHVAHLGGSLAFMMQRIEDNFTDWKAFARSPWEELRKFWFDAANFHTPALVCMEQTFSHERLLMGSDFPYFQDEKYTRATGYIKDAPFDDRIVDDILRHNAARLLGLG